MPIRFRCAYCNQLMAISTRKAGNVVACPKCAGQIIVPTPEGVSPENATDTHANLDPEIEAMVEAAATNLQPTVKAPAEPAPLPKASQKLQEHPYPSIQKKQPGGMFLSTKLVVIALVAALLIIILAFVLGLVVGRSLANG